MTGLPDVDDFARRLGRGPSPAGFRRVWRREDEKGNPTVVPLDPGEQPRPCRWLLDDTRRSCKAPSVAKIRRGTKRPSWWHYCGDHLYGRVVVDGTVWFVGVEQLGDREDAPC